MARSASRARAGAARRRIQRTPCRPGRRRKAAAEASEAAYRDGVERPPARGGAKPPYELQPGTGRRGPAKLWERFDEAVAELDRVSEGRSLRAVGRAYADLADVLSKLAAAVERED